MSHPESLMRLDLYNKNRVWQCPVGDFSEISGTKKFDNISDFDFTVKATHERLGLMLTPGTRAKLRLRGETLIEGPIREHEGEGPGVSGEFTFNVEDNFRILRNFLIYQRPGESMANQSLAYRYEQTGNIETVFKDIVTLNIADRSVEPIIVPASQARGGIITAQARMAKVYNEFFPMLEAEGLGVSVVASPAGLTVDVFELEPYGIKLDEGSRAIRKWKYKLQAPSVTDVVVAGNGEGTLRTFTRKNDPTREALWGDKIEVLSDARDADDLNTYDERADEVLYDGAGTASLEVTLAETSRFKFHGPDGLHVGNIVTAHVANHTIQVTDILREIEFSFTPEDGLKLKGVIGKVTDPNAQFMEAISHMDGSLNKLKASQ